jgi:hypothetical protein
MIAIAVPATIAIIFAVLFFIREEGEGVIGSLFIGALITLLCGIAASGCQSKHNREVAYQERKEALAAPWDELFVVLEQDNPLEIKQKIAERFLYFHSKTPMSIPDVGTFSHIKCATHGTNRGVSNCAALKSWLVEKLLQQPCVPDEEKQPCVPDEEK